MPGWRVMIRVYVVIVVAVDEANSQISQKEDEMKKYRKLVFKKCHKILK
jgi:hypothetical protein